MKKTFDEFIKYHGMLKICELCNWDIADIRLVYKRECCYQYPNQLSMKMAEYKKFIKNFNAELLQSKRMLEIQAKLRGNYDN